MRIIIVATTLFLSALGPLLSAGGESASAAEWSWHDSSPTERIAMMCSAVVWKIQSTGQITAIAPLRLAAFRADSAFHAVEMQEYWRQPEHPHVQSSHEFLVTAARWKAGQQDKILDQAVDCFGWAEDIQQRIRKYEPMTTEAEKRLNISYAGPYQPRGVGAEEIRETFTAGMVDWLGKYPVDSRYFDEARERGLLK